MEFLTKVNAEGKAFVKFENEPLELIEVENHDFIPFVVIDTAQVNSTSYDRTYDGFEIIDLQCQPAIELSKALDTGKRDHKLYAIRFTDKDEIIVRFKVEQGNKDANDDKGSITIEPQGVEVSTKSPIEIKYGQAIALKISSKNLKEDAYIDFKASDTGGFFDTIGKQNVHCGRIKILSNSKDKDVFDDDEIKKLSASVSSFGLSQTPCIYIADTRISALLQNTTTFFNKGREKMSHGEYTPRLNYLKNLGFIKGSIKEFNYELNNGKTYRPKNLISSIQDYIKKDINEKVGYHVYYISLINDVHVLTLLVNNTNPCHTKFQVFDQETRWKTNGEQPFSNIDNYFVSSSTSLWDWYLSNYSIESPAVTRIAKIKRK